MMYELERVLRVCNGFSCSMSATYDGCSTAVAMVAQSGYFVSASYFDREPIHKPFETNS